MSKIAFVFPGQGSQSIGMMSAYGDAGQLARATFSEAAEVLGYDLWAVVESGPVERLNETEVTQPALVAASVTVWRAWKAAGGTDPDYLAGHSLGEYSALVAAGALDFQETVGLVAERGRSMQSATPAGTGAMAAILGLDEDKLADVCQAASGTGVVSPANFNSPGQIVISGEKSAVDLACELASEAGARRAIPLAVSVPSHCALMGPAADRMEKLIDGVQVRTPTIPLIHNCDVQSHEDVDDIRQALVGQLTAPVRWQETVERLIASDVGRFAECGPGKVLTGLNKRISRSVDSRALADSDSISAIAEEWRET